MLSKRFFLAEALCLALVIILTGCSGSGTPITPDLQEIKIISPVDSSAWGSPQGLWQVAFVPVMYGTVTDFDYTVAIDSKQIKVVKPPYGNNYKMLSVVVPVLEAGDHQLQLVATLFGKQVAKGTVTFMITSDRELTIEIIEPNTGTDWDIGDINTISWTADGEADKFDISYSVNDGDSWTAAGESTGLAFDWHTPVVDNPGASTFRIKVEAIVSDVATADSKSDSFGIDYGPLATLFLEGPSYAVSVNVPFVLAATAFDQYDNIITNFNQSLFLTTDQAVALDPLTLGDGSTSGSWDNGQVSASYTISITWGDMFLLTAIPMEAFIMSNTLIIMTNMP